MLARCIRPNWGLLVPLATSARRILRHTAAPIRKPIEIAGFDGIPKFPREFLGSMDWIVIVYHIGKFPASFEMIIKFVSVHVHCQSGADD